jgi:hypothetical protein
MPDKAYVISPIDARFHAVSQDDEATTLSAWQAIKDDVQAMTDTPSGLPKVDLDYALSEVIRLGPIFSKLRAPTLALLSDEQAAKTAQAIDGLPKLAFGLLYVMRQDAKETQDGPSLPDLNSEGLTLRDQGLAWCATLETFGKLPAGTADAIRKGRHSYRETAADLQDLFDALSPHRALIAQLGVVAGNPISDADIDRMLRLTTLIRARIPEGKALLTWRVALLRLADLLARDYFVAHACASLYCSLNNDPTTLPPFGALRRPASTAKPTDAKPTDAPDQAPPSA